MILKFLCKVFSYNYCMKWGLTCLNTPQLSNDAICGLRSSCSTTKEIFDCFTYYDFL